MSRGGKGSRNGRASLPKGLRKREELLSGGLHTAYLVLRSMGVGVMMAIGVEAQRLSEAAESAGPQAGITHPATCNA